MTDILTGHSQRDLEAMEAIAEGRFRTCRERGSEGLKLLEK
ncbi:MULTISPECIES: hypothetical protein [unclassified Bradyrhizobium]|nr:MULTISPECIES: hypothetical protein [unclassified Bradyrhizobium]